MSEQKVEPGDLFKKKDRPEIWCIVEQYYFGSDRPEKQIRRWTMRSLSDHSKAAWLEEDRLLNGCTWVRIA